MYTLTPMWFPTNCWSVLFPDDRETETQIPIGSRVFDRYVLEVSEVLATAALFTDSLRICWLSAQSGRLTSTQAAQIFYSRFRQIFYDFRPGAGALRTRLPGRTDFL